MANNHTKYQRDRHMTNSRAHKTPKFGYFVRCGLGIAMLTTLAGCGLPKARDAAWRDTDRANCKVYGGWTSYTWSGACEGGFATGPGQLVGYGESTKMLQYDGSMQQGLRHGYGYMWINNDKIHGGPITRTGTFVRGALTDGTEETASNVKNYAGGNLTGSQALTSPESNDNGAFAMAILGAAVQGVAAARGKSAGQLQNVAALQSNTRATSNYVTEPTVQSQRGSVTHSPSSSKATIAATSANQSKSAAGQPQPKYTNEPDVNRCVSFEQNSTFMFLKNSCPFKVAVQFCFIGPYVRSSDCAKGDVGLEFVAPNGRSTIAGPMVERPGQWVNHWFACKDPASNQTTATANGINGTCRVSSP